MTLLLSARLEEEAGEGALATVERVPDEMVDLLSGLDYRDDDDDAHANVHAAVESLQHFGHAGRACTARHKQLGRVIEEVEHDEVQRSVDETEPGAPALPAGARDVNTAANGAEDHQHNEQWIDRLPYRAEAHNGDAGAENPELMLEADEPPHSEDRAEHEADD